MKINDTGNRREFESGAVRDVAEGKGRCDLLPLEDIGLIKGDQILRDIEMFVRLGYDEYLRNVIYRFSRTYYENFYTAMLEVAVHYEDGCQKYGERNWEKGIPLHCYIDSGVRHYFKFMRGDQDERHDRAFLWNMLGALWTKHSKPELCDLPFAKKTEGNEAT